MTTSAGVHAQLVTGHARRTWPLQRSGDRRPPWRPHRRMDADPHVDDRRAVRRHDDRVAVELGDRRQVLGQRADAAQDVLERRDVGRRRAAKARQQRERRERTRHLVHVALGQRREPDADVGEQLGRRAARRACDDGPEQRVVRACRRAARRPLRPSRWTRKPRGRGPGVAQAAAHRARGRSTAVRPRSPSRTAPTSVLCSEPGRERLERHLAAELRGRRRGLGGRCARPAPLDDGQPVAARERRRRRRARASPRRPPARAASMAAASSRRGAGAARPAGPDGRARSACRSAPRRRARVPRPPGSAYDGHAGRRAGARGGSAPVSEHGGDRQRRSGRGEPCDDRVAPRRRGEHERRHVDDRERVDRRGPRPASRSRRAAAPRRRRRACRQGWRWSPRQAAREPCTRVAGELGQLEPGGLAASANRIAGPPALVTTPTPAPPERAASEQRGDVEQLAVACRCGSRRPGGTARRRSRRTPRRARRCASRRRARPAPSGRP